MSCLKRLFSCLLLFVALCLLLSALVIYTDQVQTVIGKFLIVKDDLYPSDVIHVIAGDDHRTEYAIQLYQAGFAKTIFFTGGWCTIHGYNHGEHGMQLALSEGVPLQDIAYDDSPVHSTYDETLLLKQYLEQNQPSARSVIVVSDLYHMRRARWTNRMIFGDSPQINMQPVPFEQSPFKEQWWTDKDSRRFVIDEYEKLVYYFFRYQLGWKWLAFLDKN